MPKTTPLCRLTTVSHGAAVPADAMTDPRPRVTNRIGNAQHTSVVRADTRPTTLLIRSTRISFSSRHALRTGGRGVSRVAGSPSVDDDPAFERPVGRVVVIVKPAAGLVCQGAALAALAWRDDADPVERRALRVQVDGVGDDRMRPAVGVD